MIGRSSREKQSAYAGKHIAIRYISMKDGGPSFALSAYPHPPTRDEAAANASAIPDDFAEPVSGVPMVEALLNPIADTPSEEAYGLPDCGVEVYSLETEVTKDELQFLLTHQCSSAPQLAQSPRFRYLLGLPGQSVTLTPP